MRGLRAGVYHLCHMNGARIPADCETQTRGFANEASSFCVCHLAYVASSKGRKICRLADALAPARPHTLLMEGTDERIRQVNDSVTAASDTILGCPFCQVYEHTDRHDGARCLSCRGFLSEGLLKALRGIPGLPEIFLAPPADTPARGTDTGSRDSSSSFSGRQAQGSRR
jgi:hypothetical protein